MAAQYSWWLLAIALGVAEMFTGSFYLLVLAAGAAVAGFAALAGFGLATQLLVAAVVAAVGALLVRRFGPRRNAAQSGDLNLDIGQTVLVERWDSRGLARVPHRGALWDAEAMPGEPQMPGRYTIRAIEGSRLRLVQEPPKQRLTQTR